MQNKQATWLQEALSYPMPLSSGLYSPPTLIYSYAFTLHFILHSLLYLSLYYTL